ncbi:MAG: exosortase/archaeosortase family protein [Candidatus Micrarchaeia archaeon]
MADKGKTIGIIVLLVAFALGAVNSVLVTNPSILDTDSSTYVIVVMLMLPVMIIFSAKEDLKLVSKPSSAIYGAAIFVAFLLIMVLSRLELSFAYFSYRLDTFIWPIFIMALVATLFGPDGVRKMKALPVYALFASPLLLLPLFGFNGAWASANSSLVYAMLKAFGVPLSRIGNTFSGLSGPAITISATCVSLGTFVALLMFMIPVAYLYRGSMKGKILWLAAGVVLMLLLNILRIASVMLAGAYYGLDSSVLLFHLFAGQVLFYIAVIAMIILGGRFGLHIEKLGAQRSSRHQALHSNAIAPLALALLFGGMALALTTQYGSAINTPALLFDSNSSITQSALIGRIIASLESTHSNIVQLYTSNTLLLYSLDNKSANSTIYALVALNRHPNGGYIITNNYSTESDAHATLLANGIALKGISIGVQNRTFEVDYFSVPYNVEGAYVTEDYELFAPSNESYKIPLCNAAMSNGLANNLESELYNALEIHGMSTGFMCAAYRIAESA